MINIIIAAIILKQGETIPVFDCDNQKTVFKTIDLREPSRCPDPQTDYDTPLLRTIQVVQTDAEFPITAYKCNVIMSKEVTRCGFDSIHYGSDWPLWKAQVEVTPEECRQAVISKSMTVKGRTYSNLNYGATTSFKFYSHGSKDKEGNCATTNFRSENYFYQNAYEETTLEITIQHVRGTANTGTGVVFFANGLRARYQDTVIRDALEGVLVWNATTPNCEETTSQVYLGNAELHLLKRAPGIQGAILLVKNDTTHQYAGLIIKEPKNICKLECYSTQITSLAACILREFDSPMDLTFKAHINPHLTNTQTQLSFLHINTNLENHKKFEVIQKSICQNERRIMFNKLQAIAGTDNPYALLDLYGKGHVVYRAGAVVHVAKCYQLDAGRASFPNCTTEIPVSVNGSTKFADPFTWVLRSYPTIVPCSRIMQVKWKINENWYCATPEVIRCEAPDQLNVTNDYLPANDFTQGLGKGIFTEEQLAQHRKFTISVETRQAASAHTTNSAIHQSPGAGRLGFPIADPELHTLVDLVGGQLFPFFWILGKAWIYLSGVLMAIVMIKTLAGCILRGYVTWENKGWGRWMIWNMWETVYLLFHTPKAIVQATLSELQKEVDRVDKGDGGTDGFPLQDLPDYHQLNKQLQQLISRQEELEHLLQQQGGNKASAPMRAGTQNGGSGASTLVGGSLPPSWTAGTVPTNGGTVNARPN